MRHALVVLLTSSPPEPGSDRMFFGGMRTGDVAVNVSLTQAVLVEPPHRFAARIETRNDLALHVDDLLSAVDAKTAIGVVPDHHDRERIEGWGCDAVHRRIRFALEVGIGPGIHVAVPGRHGVGQVAQRNPLKLVTRGDLLGQLLDGIGLEELAVIRHVGVPELPPRTVDRLLIEDRPQRSGVKVLTPFLRSLVERGLDVSQGVLVILDGGKGLRVAVRKAFWNQALVHRCQWHKRENVVSYLAKREQALWRQRLQRAYNRPEYDEALTALETLHRSCFCRYSR